MMKVVIDESTCTGCGTCESICPEVFQLGDDGLAHVVGECEGLEECCQEAADNCPVEAITIE
ncbi:ferredoxin [Geoglobus acetivorans]